MADTYTIIYHGSNVVVVDKGWNHFYYEYNYYICNKNRDYL